MSFMAQYNYQTAFNGDICSQNIAVSVNNVACFKMMVSMRCALEYKGY